MKKNEKKIKLIQRRMLRIISIVASAILPMIFLCACGSGDESTQKSGMTETPMDETGEESITFDWYVNYTWYNTPWGGNVVTDKITEDTGVSINFISPIGNAEEKFNALISSNTLPDIITLGWWETQIDEMIDGEMVYALNELADEYDPYFWDVADSQTVAWYTREDGNIYCYPNSSYTPSDYENNDKIGSNQTFLVRKDIYEAIGSPDMTTPEGFKNAVHAAVEMFPEVNGEPLIPIGAHEFTTTGCVSFDQYLQNFLAIPFEVDGEYYDRFTDPSYIAWLKTYRELGAEGYLAEDIFIDQRTQMEEKLAQGRYFCMIFQRTDMADQQTKLYTEHPERIYMAVDGPKNANGDDPVLPGAGINGWTVTLISKNCKQPERAIQFLSYLMSEEGQKTIYIGVEGITYDMAEGKPVLREEFAELLNHDRKAFVETYGADDTYWMLQDNVMQLKWKLPITAPNGQLEEWTYPYSHYMAQYELSYERNTEVGDIDINIKKLWSQVLPSLLLAPSEEEFDAIFQEFLEERDRLGFELYKDENTRLVNENKKKLGIG